MAGGSRGGDAISGQGGSGRLHQAGRRDGRVVGRPQSPTRQPAPADHSHIGPIGHIADLQQSAGNRAVSQLLTAQPVVQRLWPGFTWIPESGGAAKRKKILSVDNALTAFHKVDPKDYKGKKQAAQALVEECTVYLGRKHRAEARRTGVKALLAQAMAEVHLYGQLASTEGLDYAARLDALLALNDVAAGYRADLNNHITTASTDIKVAVTQLLEKHDQADPKVLQKVFALEIAHLKEIAADESAPKIVRQIVSENLAHVDKIHFRAVEAEFGRATGPGAREAKADEQGGGMKYVVNHQLIQPGGAAERTGSLVHELTHVVSGEAFDSAPLFVVFKKGKLGTDAGRKEIKSLAVDRKAKSDKLVSVVNSSDGLRPDQKAAAIDKIGYGSKSKLGAYLENFKKQFGEESPVYTGLRALALDPDINQFDATLIEYDSVINQVVLYFHEWGVPQDLPAYALARDLAVEAADYRKAHGA